MSPPELYLIEILYFLFKYKSILFALGKYSASNPIDFKKSLIINYSKSEFFNNNWHELESVYDKKFDTLIDLNLEIILVLQKKFNIKV